MSYILDALKKSEQERGHGSAPSVQTLHSSSLSYNSSGTPLWPYVLLAAILINLAALVFFMMDRKAGEAYAPPESVAADAVAETGTSQQVAVQAVSANAGREQTEETVYKPVSMPGTGQRSSSRVPPTPMVTPVQAAQTSQTILDMEELPFDVLQQIPAMEFSAHVYSSNPIQRSLVINGRFMEEGDRLAGDVYLDEITPDGAIFDFQGQRFQKRIVSAWN